MPMNKIFLKALTDLKFRKMLTENPEKALTPEELSSIKGGVEVLLDLVDMINEQSLKIGTAIFCAQNNPY
jgi:hypothetical protein